MVFSTGQKIPDFSREPGSRTEFTAGFVAIAESLQARSSGSPVPCQSFGAVIRDGLICKNSISLKSTKFYEWVVTLPITVSAGAPVAVGIHPMADIPSIA